MIWKILREVIIVLTHNTYSGTASPGVARVSLLSWALKR